MENKKVRIKDIAKLAGVSVGTVDRVLHNRGKVSEDALLKVMATLHEIDYKPNLIARTLGSRKTYLIAILIPDPSQDEYWAQSKKGIEQAETEWAQYDFSIEPFYFDLYDKSSFGRAAEELISMKPDGILVAPIFYQEAMPYFEKFKEAGIPYILYNTNIPQAEPLSFIGQNLFDSGKVGAELMCLGQTSAGKFVVLHINEDSHNSVHLLEKERGFKAFFAERGYTHFNIEVQDLGNLTSKDLQAEIQTLLQDKQLKGVLVTTSKGISLISSYLEKNGKKNIRLIGYDLLEENIHFLKNGIIDFLINQNPKRQAFLGISHLSNYLLLRKSPPQKELFPLEIITQQNLNSYLESGIH